VPRSVLIVDDSSAFRTSARMLLKARGYDVVGDAADVATGLAKAAELRPDCVLMDVNLPDGDGVSAAARLDGPVVVLVSALDESAIGDVAASGASGFVPKSELASPLLMELLGPP
jgi:DNA-binding NarL/FixJ family response regulator